MGGGMSVHAQILSAVNQGKLAGGISQSGTLLATQMERLPPRRVQATAREVSSKLGCGGQLTKATLSCLQDVPIERLMEVTSSSDPTADDQLAWGPVVDDFSSKPFLPTPPLEVIGRVGRRGAFEVLVNDQMVYSRRITGKFPDFRETAAMVAKVEGGAEPEKILKHSPSGCIIL